MNNEDQNVDKPTQEGSRVSKPLMEKRRRARINQSLAELKGLLLKAIKLENPRHSKLEKADILEMAVRHLQGLHRQQRAATLVNDSQHKNKFLVGFEECLREVELYLKKQDDIEENTLQQLMQHLVKRVQDLKDTENGDLHSLSPRLQLHSSTIQHCNSSCCDVMESCCHSKKIPDSSVSSSCRNSNKSGCCTVGITQFCLVPKRLANGDLALVLPQNLARGANDLEQKPSTASAFKLLSMNLDSSSFPQEISSTNSFLAKPDSSLYCSAEKYTNSESLSPIPSETSDFSSDESVGISQEPQTFRLTHPTTCNFVGFPDNRSPMLDNVWRPW
ncbi:protein hairy-like [Limulus polyphemus]|uniref:Protein hairy-like n=1 Tax=Limulus polyphemus TaxID=6850 RepID=A0ABM1C4V7_LIMPO|nr:protein hairy-like [Limulus polyphemus]